MLCKCFCFCSFFLLFIFSHPIENTRQSYYVHPSVFFLCRYVMLVLHPPLDKKNIKKLDLNTDNQCKILKYMLNICIYIEIHVKYSHRCNLDRVGPVDNRPSTDQLPHIVQQEKSRILETKNLLTMRTVGPIQFWRGCVIHLIFLYYFF